MMLPQTNNLTPLFDPAAGNEPVLFYRITLPDDDAQ